MFKKTFQQLFGTAEKVTQTHSPSFPWVDFRTMEQLQDWEDSNSITHCFIFKHSTRCGISSMMLRRFESTWQEHTNRNLFLLLDLIQWRNVSDAVANKFDVIHQSPQVLVLKGTQLVEICSHGDIDSIKPICFM